MLKRVVKNPFFLVYLYAFLLFVGAMVPERDLMKFRKPHMIFDLLFSDKSFHFFGFAILAWLLCYAYHKAGWSRMPYFRAGFFAMAYGLFIELVQIPLPYRYFDVIDFAVDVAGILLGLFVFYLLKRKM